MRNDDVTFPTDGDTSALGGTFAVTLVIPWTGIAPEVIAEEPVLQQNQVSISPSSRCTSMATPCCTTISGHCRAGGWSVTVKRGRLATPTVLSRSSRKSYPQAYDHETLSQPPPPSEILNFVAPLREEPDSDDGSSADDRFPGTSHVRDDPPMQVGVDYTVRDYCEANRLNPWADGHRSIASTPISLPR